MSAETRTRILDITRLAARAGRGPLTGIDRVERAYLAELAARRGDFRLLCQTKHGMLILGPDVAEDLIGWADGAAPPAVAPLTRLTGASQVLAALARRARSRMPATALGRWAADRGLAGGSYLNVGHLALSEAVVAGLGAAGLRRAAMIHDTIPLDHPDYSGSGAPERFRAQVRAALGADLVVTPTRAVAADMARWAARLDAPLPDLLVAPLGVAPAAPDRSALPPIDLGRPYFVALGTIEPRKDHALLLDVWAAFHDSLPGAAIPRLVIAGRRGWRNGALFRRLDSAPCMNRTVFECPGLSDGAVAALLAGSAGLLHPSRAEGFGLAAAEAAALGVTVVATDLPATREVLGNYPIYASPGDLYGWRQIITTLARQAVSGQPRGHPAILPDWSAHFDLVFSRV